MINKYTNKVADGYPGRGICKHFEKWKEFQLFEFQKWSLLKGNKMPLLEVVYG